MNENPEHASGNSPAVAILRKDSMDLKSSDSQVGIGAMSTSYDDLEEAVVHGQATPTKSITAVSTPQLQVEDPIAALDALDDAVDKITAEVPDVQSSPEKPKVKKEKAAAPPVRTTKASQARISLAHGPKDTPRAPTLGRPRVSTAHQATGKRITSASSQSSDGSAAEIIEKKEVVIPHSKPRPMSMSFPTPPPPSRSTKAPTQSTFQLPGEAVAAKLKAAREARTAKEAEANKKPSFKARPVPATMKNPAAVRQTSTSKARESLLIEKPVLTVAPAHRRASSMAPSKRSTIIGPSARKVVSVGKATVFNAPARSISISKRPSTAMGALANSNRSRPSTSMALSTSSGPKVSRPAATTPVARITSSSSSTTTGTSKGKEVFNRAAVSKSAAEREKREKEDAAKKARAEAAERSRLLSREWAEKQKAKKAAAATKAVAAELPAATPTVVA